MSLRTLYDEASLWMTPGGYEDGKLFSELPTDGSGDFTFTRGSNLAATRVGPTGLIEKGRENLLLQSNQFDTTWVINYGTILGGQTGYDGSSDAWLYTDNVGTTSQSHDVRQNVSESGVNCFSIYAKMGTKDWVKMYNGLNVCYFNIDPNYAGNRVGTDNTGGGRVEDVGNGWFRLSVFDNGSTSLMLFGIAGGNNATNYISDGTGTVYIQDAQLEAGLVATDYIETGASTAQAGILEDMPRLDYSGGASCPALLLEPQRTNKLIHSEYFGAGTGWGDNGAVTRDFGYLAPDGTYSATKITNTGSGGASGYVNYGGVLPDDSRSVYARTTSGTGTANLMTYYGNTNNVFTITEEWQRFDLSSVTTTTGQGSFYLVDFRDGDLNEIILWGAQCEEASYPTSYIPTYGSSVTRSDDLGSIGDYIGSTITFGATDDFSIFYDGVIFENQVMIIGGGASTLNAGRLWIRDTQIRLDGTTPSVSLMADTNVVVDLNTRFKLLVKRNGATIDFFLDGNKLTTTQGDTDATFVINSLFWSFSNTYTAFGRHNQLLVFPTALSDTECIELTINGLKEDLITAYKTRATTLEAGAEDRLDTYLQQLEDFIIV